MWSFRPETKKKTSVSHFLLRRRLDCRGRSELFLLRLSDDPPSPSGTLGSEAAAMLPLANTVTDVLATVEDTVVLLDEEGTAVLGLGPPIAAALLSISSRSLCSSSARRAFCSAITWVCSRSFCSWSCSCFCCSSCFTRISCISLRRTVMDAPFTFTCCCTLVISERDGVFLASRDMVVREVDGPATDRGKRTEGQRFSKFLLQSLQNRRPLLSFWQFSRKHIQLFYQKFITYRYKWLPKLLYMGGKRSIKRGTHGCFRRPWKHLVEMPMPKMELPWVHGDSSPTRAVSTSMKLTNGERIFILQTELKIWGLFFFVSIAGFGLALMLTPETFVCKVQNQTLGSKLVPLSGKLNHSQVWLIKNIEIVHS